VLHSYTGSGKTLAYVLPLLQRVDPDFQAIQLVILAPSRELATQIAQVVNQVKRGVMPGEEGEGDVLWCCLVKNRV
jgi:superfamily II DNA/RNA helicase